VIVAVAHSGEVRDLRVTVNGEAQPASLGDPFVRIFSVPVTPVRERAPSSSLPNVFVGTATLNGVPARDGAVVTAWVELLRSSALTIDVTATGVAGQTVTGHRAVDVIQPLKAAEATVSGGSYSLTVVQPLGEVFAGKPCVSG